MKNKLDKDKKTSTVKNSRGVALAMVLIVLLLITSIGLSVASTTTIEVQIASRSEEATKGFYYAEAGLNMAVSMVKRMKGDFNDLLGGPDSTSGLGDSLTTRGKEFVVGNNGWATSTGTLASGAAGPMFPDTVKGFTNPEASDLPLGNTQDVKDQLTSAGLGSAILPNSAVWGGKLSFNDPATNSTYQVYVEVFDDDDAYARLFNAYPSSGGVAYPTGYNGVIAPVYKVPGAGTTYNTFDNCPNEFVECPGNNTSKFSSFSGKNKDFNARVLIRSTARQMKNVGGTLTPVSEVVVDSIVGFFPYPAVITEGCTIMSGSSKILGSYGGVHANDGLCLSGSPTVEQSATSATALCESCPSIPASNCGSGGGGGIKVCGFSGGNQPILIVPDLNPLPGRRDVTPPAPQTPYRRYDSSDSDDDDVGDYYQNGWFWVKDVVDKNTNTRANKKGADLVFLSPKSTSGSQRTRRHGTSSFSSENGLLRMFTTMTETEFTNWCNARSTSGGATKPNSSDAIVIDRGTLAASNDILIASIANNGSLSSWYKLSDGTRYNSTGVLSGVGWSPGGGSGGGGGGGGGSSPCTNTTTCPPPVVASGTPSRASNGATFSNNNTLESNELKNKVYFFDGNAVVTGNAGSDSNPVSLTIITTGYIDVQGTPNFVAQLKAALDPITPPFTNPQLLFVAGTDVSLSGNLETSIKFEGVVYAREQVGLTGNCTYSGQVVAADITSFDTKVTTNTLTGSAQVTFKGSTGALGAVKSSSYRILKF
ncbi:MAG: pilus assembly PilX N-terminal domain-containing protein [Blastocatellia bacterium]|nr:pilus assembly PilX N-terminal domain-containing protein [Blastocatellia bacterium]MBN8722717.1 pilus assembly PilX N-terminal domain-containing protein [Acidobacteriota bacterium]